MSNPSQAKGAAKGQRRTPRPRQVLRTQSLTWLAARLGRLGTLATFATLATLATACRPGSHGNASPTRTFSDGAFRWTLTRLEGATPETQVGWLDDETVLFIGSNDSTNGSPEIRGLYSWNRKSPARLVLADAYRFCFDGKAWTAQTAEAQNASNELIYRRYRLNPADLSTTWIGPDKVGPSKGYPNPYTCLDEKHPNQLKGRHWDALRPQDGYLDFGSDGSQNQQVQLITPDLTTIVPLGFTTKFPSGRATKFSEFSQEYIVYDIVFSRETLAEWNKKNKFTVHLISPKGYARPIEIGTGPWSDQSGGDRSIELTKAGIAVSSKAGSRDLKSPTGLFLLRPDQPFTKLDHGIISALTTSPDGCNLTYIQTIQPLETSAKTAHVCPPP
jgi:hypothetical protein